MTNSTINPQSFENDGAKVAYVRAELKKASSELRAKYPILEHQDAIGASIMAFSLAGMIAAASLYWFELIPWWVCVPAVALFASFIHELEHDLIHLMYFRNRPGINKFMLLLGWLVRPSTVNPLVR